MNLNSPSKFTLSFLTEVY